MDLDPKIKDLLKDFYNISGIRVSIHDASFKEIYSYPCALSPFCQCVQSMHKLRKECLLSDAYAFETVERTNDLYIYKCNFGLYEAVAPVYNYGRLVGYLMMGQVKDKDSELLDKTVKFLKRNGIKAGTITKAQKKIVCLDIETLHSYINIMTAIAENLTATNKISGAQNTLPFLIHKEIINNYKSDLTLSFLSRKIGCSIASITSAYKKEYKISIHQAIINARLSHAIELLNNTNKLMKEIAEECGFYDQNHFYRAFIKVHHISPSEYRKQNNI